MKVQIMIKTLKNIIKKALNYLVLGLCYCFVFVIWVTGSICLAGVYVTEKILAKIENYLKSLDKEKIFSL